MEATKRAKEQKEKSDWKYRISQGLEVSDDEDELTLTARAVKNTDGASDGASKGSGKRGRDVDDDIGEEGWNEDEEEEVVNKKGKKKVTESVKQVSDAAEDNKGKRTKHLNLRERKREARKVLKLAKDEEDTFMYGQAQTGSASGHQEKKSKGRNGDPTFGEVADAPPTITLKRKSGGKGAKPVPIGESGHKIVAGKIAGPGNRQAQIFKDLMQTATTQKGGGKGGGGCAKASEGVGLKRVEELKALREQVITEYRQMKGRPLNNGRSAALAVDPSRLFSAIVGAVTIRRDAGRK